DEQERMRDAIGPVRRLPDRRAGDDCWQDGSHQNTLMRSGSSLSFSGEPTASDCSDRKFSDRYTVSLCASSAGDATRTWQYEPRNSIFSMLASNTCASPSAIGRASTS